MTGKRYVYIYGVYVCCILLGYIVYSVLLCMLCKHPCIFRMCIVSIQSNIILEHTYSLYTYLLMTMIHIQLCIITHIRSTSGYMPIYTVTYYYSYIHCHLLLYHIHLYFIAIHKCPHCHRTYEYSIENYHTKITCPHTKCNRPFGFILYDVSDRVMKQLRIDLKEAQERKYKLREQKQRRQARAHDRKPLSTSQAERAFILGLIDCCPRYVPSYVACYTSIYVIVCI